MLFLNRIHHVAIICSDYKKSKHFYTEILGLKMVREIFRAERNSYKLDLSVNATFQIELFSFPNSPQRSSQPEACGLRHLAFEVPDILATKKALEAKNCDTENIRTDAFTNKKFFFIADPDALPIEFYEA